MKKIIALAIIATAFTTSVPALAADNSVVSSCLIETGQLRVALGQTQQNLDALNAKVADLTKQLEEAKKPVEAKPTDTKPAEVK